MMTELQEIAPQFVAMAHRIVWASVATVDGKGRPFTRMLHPLWIWDGVGLHGWIATGPTPTKRAHLNQSGNLSLSYWTPTQDTCQAECRASWAFDDATRTKVWNLFKDAPAPVGYDPAIIPGWTSPTVPSFAALRLEPWRLRLMAGEVMTAGVGQALSWKE